MESRYSKPQAKCRLLDACLTPVKTMVMSYPPPPDISIPVMEKMVDIHSIREALGTDPIFSRRTFYKQGHCPITGDYYYVEKR